MKPQTVGISPKITYDLLVSVVVFVVLYFIAKVDPVLAAGIAKILGTAAGATASPGYVATIDTNVPPDEGDAGHAEPVV